VINEGCLSFFGMAIDQQPFPSNVLDLQGKKVLIRQEATNPLTKITLLLVNPGTTRGEGQVLGKLDRAKSKT
jgi:hypothetical protein